MSLSAHLRQFVDIHLPEDAILGIAVSGGGDSMAMLYAAHQALGPDRVIAATVDHGLRPEARQEADFVAAACFELDIEHETLTLDVLAPGNVQAAARQGRYDLLAAWGKRCGVHAIALAHSQDDVAETFLLRLARGSGVDGLAIMPDSFKRAGVRWLRPFLNVSRGDLRNALLINGRIWREDPSNEDLKYDRIKVRKLMPQLAEIGLTVDRLTTTAQRMSLVKDAVSDHARDMAKDCFSESHGDVLIDMRKLGHFPVEIAQRIVATGLGWVSSNPYRPRNAAIVRFLDAPRSCTLHGCDIRVDSHNMARITREFNAVRNLFVQGSAIWDGRWSFKDAQLADWVGPLGAEGLKECPDWRAAGLPYESLLSSPALWREGRLMAAPLAGFGARHGFQQTTRPEF